MHKTNEIEIFEFFKQKEFIKGTNINMNDLKMLFKNYQDNANNKTYKNYKIKMLNNDCTLVYNTNDNSTILLQCVNKHTDSKELMKCTNCPQVKSFLDVDMVTTDCTQCYINYINKIQQNKL